MIGSLRRYGVALGALAVLIMAAPRLAWADGAYRLEAATFASGRTTGIATSGYALVGDWVSGTPQSSQYQLQAGYAAAVLAEANAAACNPCDTNCDGSVNMFDIQPLVELLAGVSSTPCSPCAADTNRDGSINMFDIQGFVECLGG